MTEENKPNEQIRNGRLRRIADWLLPAGFFLLMLFMFFTFLFRVSKIGVMNGGASAPDASVSVETLMDGSYLNSWNSWFTNNFFGKNATLSLYNQINYSVFHDEVGGWLLGKDGMLFQKEFSTSYAEGGLGSNFSQEQFDAYALQLRKIQDKLESIGKSFVYLLTPYKTEIYPEKLPWNYRILAEHYADTGVSDLTKLKRSLEENGVHYYDMTDDIKLLCEKANFDVFTLTGHHLSLTGMAAEMNTLFQRIAPMTPGINYPVVELKSIKDELFDIDMDIYDGLNLYGGKVNEYYQKPELIFSQRSTDNLFMFGTSNCGEIWHSLVLNDKYLAFDNVIWQQYCADRYETGSDGYRYYSFAESDPASALDVLKPMAKSDLIILEQGTLMGLIGPHEKFVNYVYENLDKLSYIPGQDTITCDGDTGCVELENFYDIDSSWGGRYTTGSCAVTVQGKALSDSGNDIALRLKMNGVFVDQQVELFINGTSLGTVTTKVDWPEEYLITVPKELVSPEQNRVELRLLGEPHSHKEIDGLDDISMFGLAVWSLQLEVN